MSYNHNFAMPSAKSFLAKKHKALAYDLVIIVLIYDQIK